MLTEGLSVSTKEPLRHRFATPPPRENAERMILRIARALLTPPP